MTDPEFNRAKEKKSKLISKKINSIHLYSCRCSTYFRHWQIGFYFITRFWYKNFIKYSNTVISNIKLLGYRVPKERKTL